MMVRLGPTPVWRNVELLTMTIVPVDIIDVIVVEPYARLGQPMVRAIEVGAVRRSVVPN